MNISLLNDKKICLLGFGVENQATLRALEKYAPEAQITIADRNDQLAKPETCKLANLQTGQNYLSNLDSFDVLIKSPGIPPCPELDAVRQKITNSTQIFLDTVREKGSTVIGVTGSKGKSTTTSVIAAILKEAGKDAHLVGNIGIPTLDFLEKAKEGTIFVQEMSSFQLMDLTASPEVAIVTSLFPEHLDYHGSMEQYIEAKKHIAKFQSESDTIFYASSPQETEQIAAASPGTKISYSEEDAPINVTETKLIGTHNQRNIAGAWKVAEHFGIDQETAIKAIKAFEGLPHRLESLGTHHEIHWIDDAISTTPESTIAALDSLGDDVRMIILGGQDRGIDFTELGKRIASSPIETVILFPESGSRIRKAIETAHANVQFHEVATMEDAVLTAKSTTSSKLQALSSPICLLSTASPSYNMFKNFEEKGDAFAKAIES